MLTDKQAHTSMDGLNQKFKLIEDEGGRKNVQTIGDVSQEALGDPILTKVNVHDHLTIINAGRARGLCHAGEAPPPPSHNQYG